MSVDTFPLDGQLDERVPAFRQRFGMHWMGATTGVV